MNARRNAYDLRARPGDGVSVGGRVGARPPTFNDRIAYLACRLYRAGDSYNINRTAGVFMPKPESMLERVVAELRRKAQEALADLESFRQRAAAYEAEMNAEIERTNRRIQLFTAELDAMRTESSSRSVDPTMPSAAYSEESDDSPVEFVSISETIRLNAGVILKEAKCPLPQRKIREIMESRGVKIPATNPNELIRIALLRRPSEFVNVPSKGWTLVGRSGKPMYE